MQGLGQPHADWPVRRCSYQVRIRSATPCLDRPPCWPHSPSWLDQRWRHISPSRHLPESARPGPVKPVSASSCPSFSAPPSSALSRPSVFVYVRRLPPSTVRCRAPSRALLSRSARIPACLSIPVSPTPCLVPPHLLQTRTSNFLFSPSLSVAAAPPCCYPSRPCHPQGCAIRRRRPVATITAESW